MKQLLLAFLLLLFWGQSHAQNQTYFISGGIGNANFPMPVQLSFFDYGTNSPIDTTVSTDAQGNVHLNMSLPVNIDPNFQATFTDCNGLSFTTYGYVDMPSLYGYFYAEYCPSNPHNCVAQWWGGVTDPTNNPQTVYLSNASTNLATASFGWDFGNGDVLVSSQSNISYTYALPGAYTICLTMTDSACNNTYCETLHVNMGQTGNCGASFAYGFQGAGSTVAFEFVNTSWTTDTNAVYTWYFDTAVVVTNSPSVYYTFPQVDMYYNVCLSVTNSIGCSDTYCETISTFNPGPICSAYFYNYATMGASLNRTFYNLSHPLYYYQTSPNASYHWDFGDGDTLVSSQEFVEHLYSSPGYYNVCLTVVDTNCLQTYCEYVEAGNVQAGTCFAGIGWYQNDPYNNPEAVNFTNNSVNFDIYNTSFFWDFGDGNTSTDANPYHVYADTGNYTVTLTMNYNGCTDTRIDIINIYSWGVPCQASFYILPDTNNMVLQIVHNSQGQGLMYHWDFGDGNYSNDPYPMHTYADPGTYQICLNAFDLAFGCHSFFCDTIVIDSNGFVLRGGSAYVLQVLPADAGGGSITLGTPNTNRPDQNWQLFPNPTNGQITIKTDAIAAGDLRLSVLNALGQEVFVAQTVVGAAGAWSEQLSLESLPDGAYWLRTSLNGQDAQVMKFIKMAGF